GRAGLRERPVKMHGALTQPRSPNGCNRPIRVLGIFHLCRRRLRRFRLSLALARLLDKLHPCFPWRLVDGAAWAAQRDNMSRGVTPGMADRALPVSAQIKSVSARRTFHSARLCACGTI